MKKLTKKLEAKLMKLSEELMNMKMTYMLVVEIDGGSKDYFVSLNATTVERKEMEIAAELATKANAKEIKLDS